MDIEQLIAENAELKQEVKTKNQLLIWLQHFVDYEKFMGGARENMQILKELAQVLKCRPEDVNVRVDQVIESINQLEKQKEELLKKLAEQGNNAGFSQVA